MNPDETANFHEEDEDPEDIQRRFEQSTRGGVTAPPVEIRPITLNGHACMWGIVDTRDDLVLFGAVGRKEAEDLLEMVAPPGELEAARRNALSHAHEHVDSEIAYDERYAARLPAVKGS